MWAIELFSSNGTSFSYNNGTDGEFAGSRPTPAFAAYQ